MFKAFVPTVDTANSVALEDPLSRMKTVRSEKYDAKKKVIVHVLSSLYGYGARHAEVLTCFNTLLFAFELSGSLLFISGIMTISLCNVPSTRKDGQTETFTICPTYGFNLEKLALLEKLLFHLKRGRYPDISLFMKDIADLKEHPDVFPFWLRFIGFFLISFTAAISIFHSDWLGGAIAGGLGLFNGVIYTISPYFLGNAPFVMHFIVCYLTAVFDSLIYFRVLDSTCYNYVVIVAAVFWIVPGFLQMLSIMELGSNALISSISTFMLSLLWGMFMAAGFYFGRIHVDGSSVFCYRDYSRGISPFWDFLLIPLFALSCCILFRCSLRQIPFVVAITAVVQGLLRIFEHFYDSVDYHHVFIVAAVVGIFHKIVTKFISPQVSVSAIFIPMLLFAPGMVLLLLSTDFVEGAYASENIKRVTCRFVAIHLGLMVSKIWK